MITKAGCGLLAAIMSLALGPSAANATASMLADRTLTISVVYDTISSSPDLKQVTTGTPLGNPASLTIPDGNDIGLVTTDLDYYLDISAFGYLGPSDQITFDNSSGYVITTTISGLPSPSDISVSTDNGTPFTFTADGASGVLSFTDDPRRDYTDDFRFTPLTGAGSVPEPASWAMMLVGFGGLGAALRRRSAHSRLAAASSAA